MRPAHLLRELGPEGQPPEALPRSLRGGEELVRELLVGRKEPGAGRPEGDDAGARQRRELDEVVGRSDDAQLNASARIILPSASVFRTSTVLPLPQRTMSPGR